MSKKKCVESKTLEMYINARYARKLWEYGKVIFVGFIDI